MNNIIIPKTEVFEVFEEYKKAAKASERKSTEQDDRPKEQR